MNCSSIGGILERFHGGRGEISEGWSDVFPRELGHGTTGRALKAAAGGSSQFGDQGSFGQERCQGHMMITGGEPLSEDKALEMYGLLRAT